jgi:hypothetical protein
VARVLCHYGMLCSYCNTGRATSLFSCQGTRADGQGKSGKEKCQSSQGIQEWIKSCAASWAIPGAFENKQGGQATKSCGPAKASNCVSPADKCPVHPDGNHTWGDCYQNIVNKDKTCQGSKTKGKTSTHGAKLMDIEPAEKATNCALSLITAISKSKLYGDELSAYMLDSFNKTLGCLSNHLADLKKAKTTQLCHLILFKRLSALRNLSHIILTKSHFMLSSRQ